MISKPSRKLLVEVSWFAGLAATLLVVAGLVLTHLESRRSRVPVLQQEVERKEQTLREPQPDGPALAELEVLLSAADDMAATESERVSTLSTVARRAGVTLVAMRSLEDTCSDDGAVLSCSHRVGAVGSYQQLARFLGAIQAAPGIVGIEELEMRRDEDSLAETLRASLRITWYAVGSGDVAAEAPGGEG